MSKIQEAIRRLQTTPQPGTEIPVLKVEDLQTVAVLTHEHDLPSDGYTDDARPAVMIDYDMLRRNGLLAPVEQQRHIADQYRIIKRPLLDNASGRNAHKSDDANLIMVASALSGDGKTFNCINLALSMATEKDKSVLLVDADVAKPHISGLFGIENEPGLIDLLTDDSLQIGDVLLRTNIPGLQLLSAGRRDEHATELLASKRMATIVHELSKTFPNRIVIFDSPPLLLTSESRVLANQMGQIVVVVSSGTTPQHAVLEAIDSLDHEKAICLVLNRSGKGFGGGGYGGYGGYGDSAVPVNK